MDVARIESNRVNSLQIRKEKLDLVKEINDSIKTELEQKIKNKNIEIDLSMTVLMSNVGHVPDRLRLNPNH